MGKAKREIVVIGDSIVQHLSERTLPQNICLEDRWKFMVSDSISTASVKDPLIHHSLKGETNGDTDFTSV